MSPQHPLSSGFGAKTTTREVIGERRIDGTTAIVTGGYAGIGLEQRACSPPPVRT